MEGMPQVIAIDVEGNVKGMTLTRNVKQFQAIESNGDEHTVETKAIDDAFVDLNR